MNQKYAATTENMDVSYVAHLARLQLSEEETALFQAQLGQVLHYINQLNELDVEGVEPTAHAVSVNNVFREDEPRPGMSHADFLMNAPEQRGGQVVVPRMIE